MVVCADQVRSQQREWLGTSTLDRLNGHPEQGRFGVKIQLGANTGEIILHCQDGPFWHLQVLGTYD